VDVDVLAQANDRLIMCTVSLRRITEVKGNERQGPHLVRHEWHRTTLYLEFEENLVLGRAVGPHAGHAARLDEPVSLDGTP
jgi:hypothetical protein